ncbi:MAG: permease [Candidatus Omnitrophica bacterium]|nr:permease [Candidatus Omnitrophota bacterium]
MLMPTIVMAVLAVVLVLIGYYKGEHVNGLREAMVMTLQILPLLVLALIIAGMVRVLLPQEAIAKWIGNESGVKGILIGTVAGAFTPGGPYVSMPLVAGLLRSGASMGTLVAYLTGWSLWAFSRLPIEVGIIGWRFAFIRFISVLILPPIAGFSAQFLSKFIR